MTIKKILAAVDFSEEAEVAIGHALRIAKRTEGHVTLLHVGSVPDLPIGTPATMHATMAEYLRIAGEDLAVDRERLGRIREQISNQGVEVSQMVVDGIADQQIRAAAEELDVDLIVMGTHGRTGLKRFFLGSVAERVVRFSKKHVLVARTGAKDDDADDADDADASGASEAAASGFQRILVATELADIADHTLEVAIGVAAPGATIDVLHCWHLPPMSYPHYAPTKAAGEVVASLRKSVEAGTEEVGNALVERHRRPGVELRFHQAEDAPASGIQRWIEEHGGYDLVVTGSHERRGPARLLLGSVAEFTVRHSPCSVLVVHSGDGTENDS